MTENINFGANDEQDDTEGHIRIADAAPAAQDDDEDDTTGHIRIADEAPGFSGALNVDPKTQS